MQAICGMFGQSKFFCSRMIVILKCYKNSTILKIVFYLDIYFVKLKRSRMKTKIKNIYSKYKRGIIRAVSLAKGGAHATSLIGKLAVSPNNGQQ